MSISKIEEIVKKLVDDVNGGSVNKDEFIFELMAAYGHRKTTIGRIKSGERNLAMVAGEVRTKRHIYFKYCQSGNVLSDIDNMKKEPSVTREKIRFVIATDFDSFVALDTRTGDTLDIEFNELGKHFDFFLPWAGMEKAVYRGENPADVKAAEKMAKLFDLIKADNFNDDNKHDKQALHNLNVFLTRLLFCFFAEDTGIFKLNQFSGELESHTKVDGSDVDSYLNRLFEVLNTPKDKRTDLPHYLADFEYVNGGLFADSIMSPRFSHKSRKMLIECGGKLDWSDINPDIFGSMIQAVVHPDQRGGMGMHYTSVTNIMKVIEPLFLDELYAELENIEDNIDSKLKLSRLRKLHDRIAEIKVFDPACGSGNFLILAFKELRKLELEIIKRLQEINRNDSQDDLFSDVGLDSSFSRIKLSQFYGIELDDFAHEVAILSLWLAEHQMNVEFKAEFGKCKPLLPLQEGAVIENGNALKIRWESICSPKDSEVYIIGNPPYKGFNKQSSEQKKDMKEVFPEAMAFGKLDYVACWIFKAMQYAIKNNVKYSFLTTSSICQGEQVELIWPCIFDSEQEIFFAYRPFPWRNNAKDNASVMCIVFGIRNKSRQKKTLYENGLKRNVHNINGYLVSAPSIYVHALSKPRDNRPIMTMGSNAIDGLKLILTKDEKEDISFNYPDARRFIKRFMGGADFLSGKERYCLWIEDNQITDAERYPFIKDRIDECRRYRLSAGRDAKKVADKPHRFCYRTHQNKSAIIVPQTTTDNRDYLPIGLTDPNTVISAKGFAIYDFDMFLFGILSSKMHMTWMATTSGKPAGGGYAYSVKLTYNTFPIPEVDDRLRAKISDAALNILTVREKFPERTLAKLYERGKSPQELLNAHRRLDDLVDKSFSNRVIGTSEERLAILFKAYEFMTGGQNV